MEAPRQCLSALLNRVPGRRFTAKRKLTPKPAIHEPVGARGGKSRCTNGPLKSHTQTVRAQDPLGPAEIKDLVTRLTEALTEKLRLTPESLPPRPPIRFRPRSGPMDGLSALYDPERRVFRFSLPFHASVYATVVVGEEVTHYLQHAARPELFQERTRLVKKMRRKKRLGEADLGMLWTLQNFIEGVGLFAGLTVADLVHGPRVIRELLRSNRFWNPDILLDAAHRPVERGLPKPVQKTGFNYGVGYALAILMYRRHRTGLDRRLRDFFWLQEHRFQGLIDGYDAAPRLYPPLTWASEKEVRAYRLREAQRPKG